MNIETAAGLLESLSPIDDKFESFIQGKSSPLGNGLYEVSLINNNRCKVGYALYDNGTSIYNDEPMFLGYHIENENPDNGVYCPHCGECIYVEDDLYIESAPASSGPHYNSLKQEHLDYCWDNPDNRTLIPFWKKETAHNHMYGLWELLSNWEVSRFSVNHDVVGNCSVTLTEVEVLFNKRAKYGINTL